MVISKEDKAVLLERLQKARETKAAKVAAKKGLTPERESPASVKEPEPPAPVAAPAPAPLPEPTAPAPAPPPAPPVVPDVPDLVAASKKPAKKKCFIPSSDEDSDEEAELPPKRGSKKKQEKPKYMKIVLYKEPKNAAAFQQLMEAVQDEDPEPEVSPPASASIGRGCKFDIKNKTPAQSRTLPSPQELMRRAALEFFS